MTDGPFKNLRLDPRSKRFAEVVQNDAVDQETRCACAGDAIVHGILPENSALIRALRDYGHNGQLALDPQREINAIFNTCPKSEFGAQWQRETALRLHEGEAAQEAIFDGLKAALHAHIGEFRTRTHEACLEKINSREMRMDQFDRFINGCNQTLKKLDTQRVLEAVWMGNKSEFKDEVRKRRDLDDGPEI